MNVPYSKEVVGGYLLEVWTKQVDWSTKFHGDRYDYGPRKFIEGLGAAVNVLWENPNKLSSYSGVFIEFVDALWRAGFNLTDLFSAVRSEQIYRASHWKKTTEPAEFFASRAEADQPTFVVGDRMHEIEEELKRPTRTYRIQQDDGYVEYVIYERAGEVFQAIATR